MDALESEKIVKAINDCWDQPEWTWMNKHMKWDNRLESLGLSLEVRGRIHEEVVGQKELELIWMVADGQQKELTVVWSTQEMRNYGLTCTKEGEWVRVNRIGEVVGDRYEGQEPWMTGPVVEWDPKGGEQSKWKMAMEGYIKQECLRAWDEERSYQLRAAFEFYPIQGLQGGMTDWLAEIRKQEQSIQEGKELWKKINNDNRRAALLWLKEGHQELKVEGKDTKETLTVNHTGNNKPKR